MIRRLALSAVLTAGGACSALSSSDIDRFEQARAVPTTAPIPAATAPSTTEETPADVVADSSRIGELRAELVSTIAGADRPIRGLTFYDGQLYAGLDQPGGRRSLDPATGDIILDITFAEAADVRGMAIWEGLLIQPTTGGSIIELVDPGTLSLLAAFETGDPATAVCAFTEEVVMSDGSTRLAFRDPMSFDLVRTLEVDDPAAIAGLGELVCANGQLWAITGAGSTMVRIDIITGEIISTVELAAVGAPVADDGPVTGVAHRAETDTFFLAGAGWATIVEVRLATTG